ncbi:MAG: hypothetical protein ACKO7G_04560 [Gammaproteobacteria bacterium]
MSAPTSAVQHPLRGALSAPAVVTMIVQQALRLLAPGPFLSLSLAEVAFVATAALLARRRPTMGWAFVPVMWVGVVLGALADALWLGGRLAELPALLGFAAPALVVGFASAQAWPRRAKDQ